MLKKTSFFQKLALVFFGLFLTVALLETGLRLGGFVMLAMQEYRNQQSIKQRGSFRIMCLGESTTQDQYPSHLEKILNQSKIGIEFSVIDKGIVGTNTSVILSLLEANLDKYRPDMVIAMMGINDAGKHMPLEAPSSSKIVQVLRSFRVYKMARFLWLRIVTKLKSLGFCVQDFGRPNDDSIVSSHKLSKVQLSGDLTSNPNKGVPSREQVSKASDPASNSNLPYIDEGRLYRNQGKPVESENAFKKAIEFNPKSDLAYLELGRLYRSLRKYSEAEQAMNKALEINPDNDSAYAELGGIYQFQGQCQHKFGGPEEAFEKALKINPRNDFARNALGEFYMNSSRPAEAEQTLKKGIELNPKNHVAYLYLGKLYLGQGKFSESEKTLKKLIELKPDYKEAFGTLSAVYSKMGNNNFFGIYAENVKKLGDPYRNSETVDNYRKLKRILDKRKIKLVCMQYPVQNIKALEDVFREDLGERPVFVDNERIFKEAVEKDGYNEYFWDMFGGNFGHCTQKGNELLAQNIADVILKEIFNKNRT